MTDRRDDAPEGEVDTGSTVEDEQRGMTQPLADAGSTAAGAVSESAGETVREALEEGAHEATPWIALTGVMIAVGAVLLVVLTLALVVYFAFGGD